VFDDVLPWSREHPFPSSIAQAAVAGAFIGPLSPFFSGFLLFIWVLSSPLLAALIVVSICLRTIYNNKLRAIELTGDEKDSYQGELDYVKNYFENKEKWDVEQAMVNVLALDEGSLEDGIVDPRPITPRSLQPEDYTEDEKRTIYEKLPDDLKAALFSDSVGSVIADLADKYHLDNRMLAELVGYVMLGFLPPHQLQQRLRKMSGLNSKACDALFSDLDRLVFASISPSLDNLYSGRMGENVCALD
jgi:hypothetical protein